MSDKIFLKYTNNKEDIILYTTQSNFFLYISGSYFFNEKNREKINNLISSNNFLVDTSIYQCLDYNTDIKETYSRSTIKLIENFLPNIIEKDIDSKILLIKENIDTLIIKSVEIQKNFFKDNLKSTKKSDSKNENFINELFSKSTIFSYYGLMCPYFYIDDKKYDFEKILSLNIEISKKFYEVIKNDKKIFFIQISKNVLINKEKIEKIINDFSFLKLEEFFI